MMQYRPQNTGVSFIFSIFVHIGIVCLIVMSVGFAYVHHKQPGKHEASLQYKPDVVKAVAVNQQQVEDEIHNIKASELAKKQAEIRWKDQLQHQADQAKAKRQTEESQLSSLQQKFAQTQKQAQQKQQQAEANLQRLNQLQAQAQQRLNQLQAKQSQLQHQNQSVASQLAATQLALAQQQSQASKVKLQQQLAAEQAQKQKIAQQQLMNQASRYKTLILNDIGQHWIVPDGVDKNAQVQLQLDLAPDGKVLNVKLLQSSGNAILDRSAITAVLKASPLPVPTKNSLLQASFKQINLTVKPEGLLDQTLNG